METESKKDLSFLVLNHYVKDYENVKPQGVLDISNGTKQVSERQCDANILFSLICEKLGVSAPDILPVYSVSREKTIISGVLDIPKVENNQEIELARHFHNMLNSSFNKVDILNKLLSKDLENAEREKLANKLILSKIATDGKRPVDLLFSKNYMYSSRFFSDEALKDLIKIRVAKIATFDTSNAPSAIYKFDKNLGIVDRVMAMKNISSNRVLNLVCNGEKANIMFDTEFSLKSQTLCGALNSIKQNPMVKEILDCKDIDEMVSNLQKESISKIANKFYYKTGIMLDKPYVNAVSHQVDEICEGLIR